MSIMQVYFISQLVVGISLHLACNVSKGLARIRLMPLKETGHKVGEHKHPHKGGQPWDSECQGVRMKFGARPQSFNQARTEHFIECFSVVWGKCSVSLSEKLQKLQNHASRILLFTCKQYNEDDTDKLFQALGRRKLSHHRLVATSVMMFRTFLHRWTPGY